MVLLFIADIILETSLWSVKKIYNGVHYAIYGQQETVEDKILKQLEEMREQQRKEREELIKLKESVYSYYYNSRSQSYNEPQRQIQ